MSKIFSRGISKSAQKAIASADSPKSLDLSEELLIEIIRTPGVEPKIKTKFTSIITFNQIKKDLEKKSALEHSDFAPAIALLGVGETPEFVKHGLEKLIIDNLKKLEIKDLEKIKKVFPEERFPLIAESIVTTIVTTLTEKQKTLSEKKARVIPKIREHAATIQRDPEIVKKYFKKLNSSKQRDFFNLFFIKRAEAEVNTSFSFIYKVLEGSKEGSGVAPETVITNYIREIDNDKIAGFMDQLGEIPLDQKNKILSLCHTLNKEKTLILLKKLGEEAFKTYIKTLEKDKVKNFLDYIPEREKIEYTELALLARSEGKQFAEIRGEVQLYGNYPQETKFAKTVTFAVHGLSGEELQNRLIAICSDRETTCDEVKFIIDVVAKEEQDKFLLKLLENHTLDIEKKLILLNNLGEEAFKTYIKTLNKDETKELLDNIPAEQKVRYTEQALLARSQGKSFAEIREEVKLYGNYPKGKEFEKTVTFAVHGLSGEELQKRKIEICTDPETTYDEVRFIIDGVESKEQDKFSLELLEKRTKDSKKFKEIQGEAKKIGVTEDKIFEFAAKIAVERRVSPEEISDGIEFKDKLKLAEIAQIQFTDSDKIRISSPEERGAFLRHLGNKEDANIAQLASQVPPSDCKDFAFIQDLNPELASALASKALEAKGLSLEERISLKSIEQRKEEFTKFELTQEVVNDKAKDGKFNIGEVQDALTLNKLFSDKTSARKFAILYAEVNGLKVEGKTFYENFTGFFDKIFSTQKSREEKLKKYQTELEGTFSPEKKIFRVEGDPFSSEVAKLMEEMQSGTTKSLRDMLQPKGGVIRLDDIDDLTRMNHMSEAIRIVLEERGAKDTLKETIDDYIDKRVASFSEPTNMKKKDAALKALEALRKYDETGETLAEALEDRLSSIAATEDPRNVKRYLYDRVEDKLEDIYELTPSQKLIRQVQIFETRLKAYHSVEDQPHLADFLERYGVATDKSVSEKAFRETLERISAIDGEIGDVLNKVKTPDELASAKTEIGLILFGRTEAGKEHKEVIEQERKSAARKDLSAQMSDILEGEHKEKSEIVLANRLDVRKAKLDRSIKALGEGIETQAGYSKVIEEGNIEAFAEILGIERPTSETMEFLTRCITVLKSKIAVEKGSITKEDKEDWDRVALYDNTKSEISNILSRELETLTPKWERAMDKAIDVVEGRRGPDEPIASAAATFFEESASKVGKFFQSIKGVLESTEGGSSLTSSRPPHANLTKKVTPATPTK
jgi:hypothetical protein